MKKLLIALAIQFAGSFALAIQAFPIFMPKPSPEGAKAIGVRVDANDIYIKTSSNEVIRIDKLALLEGTLRTSSVALQMWSSIGDSKSELALNETDSRASTWLFEKHKFQVTHAYCGEGSEDKHALRIDGRKIDTGMDGCMALVNPVYLGGTLWFGTNYPGEYADLPGVGILIFDVAKQRRLARLHKDLAGGESGLMQVDAELNGVWVVNDKAIHFFDRAFRRKALAYYSEQLDPTGKNWSQVQVSLAPRKHDPFAVAARIIMTRPITEQETDESYALRLGVDRWATLDGIADYMHEVSQLPQRVRSNFWVEYDAFERQYFPYWAGKPMSKEQGGKEFGEANKLLSCLYISAGSPPSSPRALVINITAAAENMNWSDAQLYEPRCTKNPVKS